MPNEIKKKFIKFKEITFQDAQSYLPHLRISFTDDSGGRRGPTIFFYVTSCLSCVRRTTVTKFLTVFSFSLFLGSVDLLWHIEIVEEFLLLNGEDGVAVDTYIQGKWSLEAHCNNTYIFNTS